MPCAILDAIHRDIGSVLKEEPKKQAGYQVYSSDKGAKIKYAQLNYKHLEDSVIIF